MMGKEAQAPAQIGSAGPPLPQTSHPPLCHCTGLYHTLQLRYSGGKGE